MGQRANQLSGRDWLKKSFSIWRDFPRDGNREAHPAAFPVSLIQQIIDCFVADSSGVVLDPFAGSGSTLLAATNAGMTSVGMDINEEYREVFKSRLDLITQSEWHGGKEPWAYEICDSRDPEAFVRAVKDASVELCVTSPPYWDILNRKRSSDQKHSITYSDSASDLGNIKEYEDFLSALGDVVENVDRALRNRCYFILNVMDLRKGSRFYPLHQDAAEVVSQRSSLILNDIIVWDRQKDYNQMRPLGYPHKFIINKVHEYLLIFRKE